MRTHRHAHRVVLLSKGTRSGGRLITLVCRAHVASTHFLRVTYLCCACIRGTPGTNNVITAMKEKGVSRVAVVTSIGTGDSEKQAPFFFKVRLLVSLPFRFPLQYPFKDAVV